MEIVLGVAAALFLGAAIAEVVAAWTGRDGPFGLGSRLAAVTALAAAVFLLLVRFDDELGDAPSGAAGLVVLVLVAALAFRTLRRRTAPRRRPG